MVKSGPPKKNPAGRLAYFHAIFSNITTKNFGVEGGSGVRPSTTFPKKAVFRRQNGPFLRETVVAWFVCRSLRTLRSSYDLLHQIWSVRPCSSMDPVKRRQFGTGRSTLDQKKAIFATFAGGRRVLEKALLVTKGVPNGQNWYRRPNPCANKVHSTYFYLSDHVGTPNPAWAAKLGPPHRAHTHFFKKWSKMVGFSKSAASPNPQAAEHLKNGVNKFGSAYF